MGKSSDRGEKYIDIAVHEVGEVIRTAKRVSVECACGWMSGQYATEERARGALAAHAERGWDGQDVDGYQRGLCCVCGSLRLISWRREIERNQVSEGGVIPPAALARRPVEAHLHDVEDGWRYLYWLRCASCSGNTWHAGIHPEGAPCADIAESTR